MTILGGGGGGKCPDFLQSLPQFVTIYKAWIQMYVMLVVFSITYFRVMFISFPLIFSEWKTASL